MTRHNDPFVDEFLKEMTEAGIAVDELASVADALSQRTPPAPLRDRLMQSLAAGGRLHRFAEQVAELLDVTRTRAEELLDAIDDAASWEPGPGEGVTLFHIEGGAAVADAITGFVRVERSGSFPHHEHLGDEAILIVQGGYRDSESGRVHRPGDVVRMPPGTAHQLNVVAGPKLIYLAIVFGGVDIGGMVLRPGDPRI